METAVDSTYGIRFYSGAVEEKCRYLFESFSSTINRNNFALLYQFNTMTGLQKLKVENGTQMITGISAPISIWFTVRRWGTLMVYIQFGGINIMIKITVFILESKMVIQSIQE